MRYIGGPVRRTDHDWHRDGEDPPIVPEPRINDVRAIEVVVQHNPEDERTVERLGWAIELPRVGETAMWVAYTGPADYVGIFETPHEAYQAIKRYEP
jgi:hypothetical protein